MEERDMVRRRLLLTVIGICMASSASAHQFSATPFKFQGSAVSASSACPYAAKATLAGYTLVQTGFHGGANVVIRAPVLVFSPGGNASKQTLQFHNDIPDKSASSSGSMTITLLPSTNTINGTYKATLTFQSAVTFQMNLTLAYKTARGACSTVYDLTFAKGIPANLLNIL